MHPLHFVLIPLTLLTACTFPLHCHAGSADDTVDFNRDVRPILANHCWSCHGRDEASRKAGLRLDTREAALAAGDSGHPAIVPGQPAASELVRRIQSPHSAEIMPPPELLKPLSARQQSILQDWIRHGASYAEHWAFIPPQRPPLPPVRLADWPVSEVDLFVLHRLEQEGLQPSAPAPPLMWFRRASLDLTGISPSPAEQQQFLDDITRLGLPAARTLAADRLLQSDRCAERLAMQWLDAARYADTNGYNNDEMRTMWPWRDWVIQAFRSGMPWDQFLIEQLAGDLLPGATISQKVATGFIRNHVLTTEGGIIEDEYHWEYVADRIHTTSTVFLGLSLQCARCHDHKYDPFSQRDYYRLAGFFNNVPDRIVSYSQGRMAEPLLKVPSAAQTAELEQLAHREIELQNLLAARASAVAAEASTWAAGLSEQQLAEMELAGLAHAFSLDETDGNFRDSSGRAAPAILHGSRSSVPGHSGNALQFSGSNWLAAPDVADFEADQPFTVATWIRTNNDSAGTVFSRMDDAAAYRGYDLIVEQGRLNAHFIDHWPDKGCKVSTAAILKPQQWHHVTLVWHGNRRAAGVRIYVDGLPQTLQVDNDGEVTGSLRTQKPFHIGRRQNSVPFTGTIDDLRIFSRALSDDDVRRLADGKALSGIREILLTASASRSAEQRAELQQFYAEHVDTTARNWRSELAAIGPRRTSIEQQIPQTMVMQEQTPRRPSYILHRGQYDQRGEQVTAGIPAVFAASLNTTDPATPRTEPTRLDFARWLVSPQNPLTARVAVNRWWEMLFGTGLVETTEDFGIQGALPSHPELLDWLACELQASGWNQKQLLKSMVLSATYGQTSDVSPELLERDPRNLLLARSSRLRLPAEMLRDNALAASTLLNPAVGGPSAKPWQPAGLWEDVSVERREKYQPDPGDGIYRRSMYTFWKRTCPPPSMTVFDAPDRETCLVRRSRTNTPLQALVLLNDPTYVEAARKLAERILLATTADDARIDLAVRIVLARPPKTSEQHELLQLVAAGRKHFAAEPTAAAELRKVGRAVADPGIPDDELAAWSSAMSVLLNLDEAITRP
jgi:cytochrome c553